MKQLIIFLFINYSLVIINYTNAQNSAKITIHLTGKTAITYDLSQIDSITFTPCQNQTKCGDSIIDIRDGKRYKTIQIGTQCWMAQNLNIGQRIDGINVQTDNGIIEKYCYNDDENNCNLFGGLYQWDEMMNYNNTLGSIGICPTGWHVPADAEWKTLEVFLDPTVNTDSVPGNVNPEYWRGTDVGTKMMKGGSSGFNAILAGYRYGQDGSFRLLATRSYFWTSDTWIDINKWYHGFWSDYTSGYRATGTTPYGMSIRCIKD